MTSTKLRLAAAWLCLASASQTTAATWQVLNLDPLPSSAPYWSPQFAVLPDGRFVIAHRSSVLVQSAFGGAAAAQTNASVTFDPAFIALKDASTAVIGAGGSFGSATPVFQFDPSAPTPLGFVQKAVVQSYAAAYWKSPITGTEGWLISGQVGTGGVSGVLYVSLSGTTTKLIVDSVAQYSSGIAADAQGDLYVGRYVFGNPTEDVFVFTAADVEAALTGAALTTAGKKQIPCASSGSLAVDHLGRLWMSGYNTDGYFEVIDTITGAFMQEHPGGLTIPGAGLVLLQPQAFQRNGIAHVALTAYDGYASTNLFRYATVEAAQIAPPNSNANWRSYHFGTNNVISGPNADPDRDGSQNLLEYASATSPTRAGGATISASTQSGALVLSFTRDAANTDLIYIAEVSSTMAANDWQEIARSTAGAATASSGIGSGAITETADGARLRVSVTAPGAQRFARLRVTLIP